MRTVVRVLVSLGVFGLALGTIYWFVAYEEVGAVLLWTFGLMPLIVAAWTWRRASAEGERPEDDPDATAAAEAGRLIGSFPIASAWPLFLTLAVLVLGAGLVYGVILLPLGVGLFAYAVLGFMRESGA